MHRLNLALIPLAAAVLLMPGAPSHAVQIGAIIDAERAAETLRVDDVRVDGATLSARLLNGSATEIRGVRLLVRHTFHWKDDFHPGDDSPGRAHTVEVTESIPPGGALAFTAPIRPLPPRDDGWFTTEVMVVGFTQIG